MEKTFVDGSQNVKVFSLTKAPNIIAKANHQI
jgi:hypothetical protein